MVIGIFVAKKRTSLSPSAWMGCCVEVRMYACRTRALPFPLVRVAVCAEKQAFCSTQ